MVIGAEHVGVPRSGICWRGHCKAAAKGSQKIQQNRQELAKDHAASPRDTLRCAVLRRRRLAETASTTLTGTAGTLPKVIERVTTSFYVKLIILEHLKQ